MRYMGRSKIRSKNYLTCRNKLLLILVTEDDSCLLCAVYLTATEVPASVKTQLLNLASLSFLLKLSYIWSLKKHFPLSCHLNLCLSLVDGLM